MKFKFDKNQWLLVALVGILLVAIAIPTQSTESRVTETSTEIEKRLEEMLTKVDGVGEVSAMITFQEDGAVAGIVIVAEGGEQAVVAQKIREVVQALFPVDSHKIKVIRGK